MNTVTKAAVAAEEESFENLPEQVREALGELAGQAKEGLLALSVGVGLGVLGELMEAEVDEVVGPKGRHDPKPSAVRHGHDEGQVTLGGRRVTIKRPRARSVDDSEEVELATYSHFADRDPLTGWCSSRCSPASPCGASRATGSRSEKSSRPARARPRDRRSAAASSPAPARTSKSRRPPLGRGSPGGADGPRPGVRAAQRRRPGDQHPGRQVALGLWEGSTENSTVVAACSETSSIAALTPSRARRWRWTAPRRSTRRGDALGVRTPVQRRLRHKERNIIEHRPERERASARRRPREAWALMITTWPWSAWKGLPPGWSAPTPPPPLPARGHDRDAHRDPPGIGGS